MERGDGGYVFVDCQCGKKLRFPYQNRALIITCPECKRSFLWLPNTRVRYLGFFTRLISSLRRRKWSTLTLIVVAAIAACFGYSVANRFSSKQLELKPEPSITSKRESVPEKTVSPKVVRGEAPIAKSEYGVSRLPNIEPSPHELSSKATTSKSQVVSLPNGVNITPPYSHNGFGILTVINGTRWDAAVKLIRTDRKLFRFVYVQRGKKVNIKHIPAGTYYFRWCTGLDWDKEKRRFQQDCMFFEADRLFVFVEKRTQQGVEYSHLTVTLHKVLHGNLKTRKISESEFDDHE